MTFFESGKSEVTFKILPSASSVSEILPRVTSAAHIKNPAINL